MRTLCLLGLVLIAGCQSGGGWFRNRGDNSRVGIQEQQRNARERLALPDEGRPLGEGVARPGTFVNPN